ncbi:MAG TPA: DUF58 domain-containing protein [Streptosporangiaceae bacterium]
MPLTPLGWGVAAASVLLYAAGAWLGYPEPAVLAVAGIAAVLAALVWTAPRPKLELSREIAPLKVERGRPAIGVLRVGQGGRAIRAGLTATDTAGGQPVAIEIPRLRGARKKTISYELPTNRRGEIAVGPLRLIRADPLGLARRVRTYGEPVTLLVRPRTVALPLLPSGRAHHLEGPTTDRAPAGTATFHALREYVIGDDLRHIHWKSSARTGTLMVRQLVDASLPQTTLVLDTRPSGGAPDRPAVYADPDDFELAVDVAASIAVGAAKLNFPVRMITASGPLLETRGGPDDIEQILDRLSFLRPEEAPRTALDMARRVRPGGSLVIVTGTDPGLTQAGALSRRFDRTVCVRVRPSTPAPHLPNVSVLDVAALEDITPLWSREVT